MSEKSFAGASTVVTGAARGMGATFAEGLARRGARVVAADINLDALQETVAGINSREDVVAAGGSAVARRADVTRPEDHLELAREAQNLGEVRWWINNAGIFPVGEVLDISRAQMETTFAVNVNGTLFGCQAAAGVMKPGGSIVNLASLAAMKVRAGRAAYSASKAAVDHLTRSIAYEFGPLGIRVNAVAPGFIDTEMIQWLKEDSAAFEAAVGRLPISRVGTRIDVMNAVFFLLSDESSYVTGHTLLVDGGSRLLS
ncbi:3-oxoacyl-[acyl-carrier protein] reductase [Arthrobacter sp. GAS37]|uniref:SDR family NAD(P)-dependent oxidoreductase n=1 Tax=Arthrobacter sp. GAS37 TaxID=3156261 RepID=UPI0038374F40